MNEYVNLILENIDKEHVCCAISDKKHQVGVDAKREWLKERIAEGHVFRKLNAQGKVFIEYAPLEKAWTPVEGQDYLYIYCLWVAGSFKGHKYGQELLEYAIADAKKLGKKGVCTISSKKKKPFVSEKSFFKKFGFEVVDTIGDYELLAFSLDGSYPTFCETAKKMAISETELTIYYSPQCPFTNRSVQDIKEYMENNHLPVHLIAIDTLEKAKSVLCVFNNWAIFKDGKFVSNTLLNENSLKKLLEQ